MGHYAKIVNGVVTKVIVADADFFNGFIDDSPGEWIQTSYNTRGGVYYTPNSNVSATNQSNALRKNYAGVGYSYSPVLDAFIPPQPFPSWNLNEDTCLWSAPAPYPTDGKEYYWNEEVLNWQEIEQ
jgi:hypothetical protein